MFVCAAAGGLPDSCCMSLPVCVVIINSSCTDNSAKHAVPTPIITPHPNNCINTMYIYIYIYIYLFENHPVLKSGLTRNAKP